MVEKGFLMLLKAEYFQFIIESTGFSGFGHSNFKILIPNASKIINSTYK